MVSLRGATNAPPIDDSHTVRTNKPPEEPSGRELELKSQLLKSKKGLNDLEEQLKDMEKQHASLLERLESYRTSNNNLMNTQQTQWGKISTLQDSLNKAQLQNKELADVIQQQKRNLVELKGVSEQLTEVKRELAACRRERDDLDALLQVRTTELKDAQAYLGKEDARAHADVQRLVQKLNAEIFQAAAQITDTLPFSKQRVFDDRDRVRAACDILVPRIGTSVVRAVLEQAHSEDSIFVQLALQAYLADHAEYTIKAWDVRFDSQCNKLLHNLHEQIFDGENQAVSARWRMMTRRYVESTIDEWPGGRERAIWSHLMDGLLNILLLSQVATSPQQTERKLIDMFGEKIIDIVKLTLEIRKAIGEDVLSSDFRIICPRSEEVFRETEMENMDDGGAKGSKAVKVPEGSPVFCTTELGLVRYEKKSVGGAGEEKLVVEQSVPVKAKVALHTMVQEWMPQM